MDSLFIQMGAGSVVFLLKPLRQNGNREKGLNGVGITVIVTLCPGVALLAHRLPWDRDLRSKVPDTFQHKGGTLTSLT